jgi:hypothetical protein
VTETTTIEKIVVEEILSCSSRWRVAGKTKASGQTNFAARAQGRAGAANGITHWA